VVWRPLAFYKFENIFKTVKLDKIKKFFYINKTIKKAEAYIYGGTI
jgi:hypothetical protein